MTPRWPAVPLSTIIQSLEAGVSVNGLDEPAVSSGEIGVLKVSCISQGRFRPLQNKRVVADDISRVSVSPRKGDILISRANTIDLVGASGYVEEDYPDLYLPDKLWRVVLSDPDFDSPSWLIALLNSHMLRREFFRRATGTSGSMKNISKHSIRAISVPRPPADVQERLGRVFELFERLINQHERAENLKRIFKRGLMQQLLAGQNRFPEFRDSSWVEVHLGEIFEERIERNRPDLPLLSVTNDRGVIPRDKLVKRDTSNPDKSKYKRVAVGDVAYNTMRMWQGVSALSSLEGIISPAYTVAVPTDRVCGSFAKHLFKYPPTINLFHRYSQGLVDDTLNLKFERFSKIKMRIPQSTEEQVRIGDILDLCDAEINLIAAQRNQVEEFKRSVLSQILSGDPQVTTS